MRATRVAQCDPSGMRVSSGRGSGSASISLTRSASWAGWITRPREGGRWDVFFGIATNEFGVGLVTHMNDEFKGFDAYLVPLRLSVLYTPNLPVDKNYFI